MKWLFRTRTLSLGLFLPILLLAAWQVSVSSALVPETLIASPAHVVGSLVDLVANGKIFVHAAVSLYRLLFGFAIGAATGLLLGIIVGTSRLADRLITPTFQLLSPVPPIAWIPLLIVIFGIGEASKVALMVIAALVVVFLNTVQGIRSADEKLIDVARAYRKTNMQLIQDVLLPSALPQIFTGLRVALGLSWILLIAAEVIASSRGLGWLIWDSRNFSRPDDMIAGMIVIGILGKVSDMALVWLEKKMTSWRRVFVGK